MSATSPPPRILIFSADIGEGHDLPARVIRDAILARRPDAVIEIRDSLEAAGPIAKGIIRDGAEAIVGEHPRIYDAQYFFLTRVRVTNWLASTLGLLVSGRGLRKVVDEVRPDVIVSTYPGANDVLGGLRRLGRLRPVPMVSAVTDLSSLHFWAHPQMDVHLILHGESAAEVRALAGSATRVEHVSGLTSPEYLAARDSAKARAELGLPERGEVVLVSGGGWGIGDLAGAVGVALGTGEDVTVVALCGRNESVQRALQSTFGAVDRVRVEGFTERMSDYLAAADVLIHSTAGLTVFEAQVRGTRVISYGWGVAHIRDNNAAYLRFGLAEVATGHEGLALALESALSNPREPDETLAELPAAADIVLGLVGQTSGIAEAAARRRGR